MGDQASGVASIFFYGGEPTDIAAAEQTKWTTWLSDVLQRVPDRVLSCHVCVNRLLALLCAAAVYLTAAPVAHAEYTPWFAPQVGDATQVISVVGAGGSSAKIDVFQRSAAGWQPLRAGIPAHVGRERDGRRDPRRQHGHPAGHLHP